MITRVDCTAEFVQLHKTDFDSNEADGLLSLSCNATVMPPFEAPHKETHLWFKMVGGCFFHYNPKNLDPTYKTGVDFWERFLQKPKPIPYLNFTTDLHICGNIGKINSCLLI